MSTAWLNLRRMAWILRVLASHALANLLGARLERWPWLARRLPPGVLPEPERLRMIFEDLGGTFLKFGQMLALQPDILSLEYCNALFKLLDRVDPFPYEDVVRVFREDLGKAPEEIFDSIEREPIATASIGQVHVAWTAGRKMAVKVQRPAVEIDFAGDIRLMVATIGLVRRLRLTRLYWTIEPMSEFVAWTREELDYRNEARYMERLRENARDNPGEHVPAVLESCTTPRILVAEFLEGLTVLGYLRAVEADDRLALRRLAAMGFDPNAFARRMIDNFLGDAFRHGIFHADLHPANLMILPGNVVGYIDFGITGVLSHYSRHNLVMMTLSYTRADPDGMCDAFLKVSTADSNADLGAFRDGLKRFAEEWYDRRGAQRVLRKNFTLVMLDMLRLSRATGVWPERDVIKYIRSAIAIDGLITRFAPGFDVGRYLAAVCDRYLRQEGRRALFARSQLVAWASASGNLLRDGPFRAMEALSSVTGEPPLPRAEAAYAAVEDREEAREEVRLRAFHLALVAFASSLVVTASGEGSTLGWNLFTAGAAVAAAALAMFVKTLHRLA
ncbi:MAG TPA: AarF/UbiB family protein [Thermoanaerobaculia bacterium]